MTRVPEQQQAHHALDSAANPDSSTGRTRARALIRAMLAADIGVAIGLCVLVVGVAAGIQLLDFVGWALAIAAAAVLGVCALKLQRVSSTGAA